MQIGAAGTAVPPVAIISRTRRLDRRAAFVTIARRSPRTPPSIDQHPVTQSISFDYSPLPDSTAPLRERVRDFIAREIDAGTFAAGLGPGLNRHSLEFSRRCGEEGFIGMTWPRRYGGGERSFLERYVVTEELLAAGAPVWAHWVADRQSGPMLMRYGREEARDAVLPRIVAGECYFCIGMSEPDSGSDLYSAKCRATPTAGGWKVDGRKIWTSNAHRSHYMIALLRTSPHTVDNRRHGLTQFLIAMDSPGIEVRPIRNLTGDSDFNEVVFDDVFVPEEHLEDRKNKASIAMVGSIGAVVVGFEIATRADESRSRWCDFAPANRHIPHSVRCRCGSRARAAASSARARETHAQIGAGVGDDAVAVLAVRCEHAVVSGEMAAGAWNRASGTSGAARRAMPNRQDCRFAQPEAAPKGCGTWMCRMHSMGSSTT